MKWLYLLSLILLVLRAEVVLSWIPSTATTKRACTTFAGTSSRRSVLLLFQHRNKSFDKDAESIAAATETGNDLDVPTDSTMLYTQLFARRVQLDLGIGKRYVCRIQQSCLNIYREPGDPFDTDNIVGRLKDGQIVTSTGPPQGLWIQHNGGGWSMSKYGGFARLEALEE